MYTQTDLYVDMDVRSKQILNRIKSTHYTLRRKEWREEMDDTSEYENKKPPAKNKNKKALEDGQMSV